MKSNNKTSEIFLDAADATDDITESQNRQVLEAIKNLNAEEFLELIEYCLDTTEVVLEGIEMANQVDVGAAALISALVRTRNGLANTVTWVSSRFETELNDVTEANQKNTSTDEYL
jgi:hypothetical protein